MPDPALASETLLQIALQFGAALDLDRLLPLVVERITELMGAERALFALCEPDGRVSRAVCHNLTWEGPGHPLPISSTVLQEVLRTRQPVIVLDALHDENLSSRQSVQRFGLRRMLAAPVEERSGGCSVLYLDSRVPAGELPESGVSLLSAIARLVGTAVENARLFEEQRFRNQLLGELVHDLRGPLAVLRFRLELFTRTGTPAQPDELGSLCATTLRMNAMIDDALELARTDAGAEPPQPSGLDVGCFIDSHLAQLRHVALRSSRGFVLERDDGPLMAETLERRLALVLDNLVWNALKYGDSGHPIRITVRRRADSGPEGARLRPPHPSACLFRRIAPLVPEPGASFLEISVVNHGREIAPAALESLFVPFVSGDLSRGSSAGLGLSIVDQCVRSLGGVVWAESGREETSFTFSLPTRVRKAR